MGNPKQNKKPQKPRPDGIEQLSATAKLPDIAAAEIQARSQIKSAEIQGRSQLWAAVIGGVVLIILTVLGWRYSSSSGYTTNVSVLGSTNASLTFGSNSPAISGVSGGTVTVNYGVAAGEIGELRAEVAKTNQKLEQLGISKKSEYEWFTDLQKRFPDGFGIYAADKPGVATPVSDRFLEGGVRIKLNEIRVERFKVPSLSVEPNLGKEEWALVIPKMDTQYGTWTNFRVSLPDVPGAPSGVLNVNGRTVDAFLLERNTNHVIFAVGLRANQ